MSTSESEYFPGSTSVQILFTTGIVLGKRRQVLVFVVLLWPLIGMQNPSHPISTHTLRAELLEFPAHCKLVCSMRNSDPGVRIVSVHRHNSDLNSVHTVQATGCNFQYGPQFWCSFGSILLIEMLLHLLEECIHDKPLHGIVRILQCLSS